MPSMKLPRVWTPPEIKKGRNNLAAQDYLIVFHVSAHINLGISFYVAEIFYWQLYPVLEVLLPLIKSYSSMNRTFHMKDTKFKLGDAITNRKKVSPISIIR